jgi:hypothetical protein
VSPPFRPDGAASVSASFGRKDARPAQQLLLLDSWE